MPIKMLTLISHPLCPFVQRAAIVLLEKGVAFERVNVDLSAKPDWFLALSPTGKVPVLKVPQAHAEDAALFESVAICEYLNETQGGSPMYPHDALTRARHRAWIEFATQTFAEGWQFLHARDSQVADAKRASFRELRFTLEQDDAVADAVERQRSRQASDSGARDGKRPRVRHGRSDDLVFHHALRWTGRAGRKVAREAVQRRAVRADDLVVVAEIEEHMRMIERRVRPDAHEFPGADFNDAHTLAIVEVWNDVVGHEIYLGIYRADVR